MNPPPRTGISRESGSVRLRTGPGPFRLRSRSAARRAASAWRRLARSSRAAACRARTCWLAGRRGGLPRRLPVCASDRAFRASQSSILACWAAATRASFSSASATAAKSGEHPVRRPARCRARNASAWSRCAFSAASRSARRLASAARIRSSRLPVRHTSPGASSPRSSPNSSSSAASACPCRATISLASWASFPSARLAALDARRRSSSHPARPLRASPCPAARTGPAPPRKTPRSPHRKQPQNRAMVA